MIMKFERISREEAGVRHWDRASELAAYVDMVAGSDETAAGAIYADMIGSVAPDVRPIVEKLCIDGDTLRGANRTAH